MGKVKSKFVCQECGTESPKWMGKCPGCGQWNTMVEEKEVQGRGPQRDMHAGKRVLPQPITDVKIEEDPRYLTKMDELDRVLGGGVVPGSLTLIGGDPGIGKSTLLLQVGFALSETKHRVLYVSGEESMKQTKMRADRLGFQNPQLYVLAQTQLHEIEEQIDAIQPDLLVIDSIQTVFHPDVTSAPGSVAQVRECTGQLMRLAKSKNLAVFIVGHVTKQGEIAGPRLLEHMVDTVLYFEGDRHHTFRILRAVKNRFGSTNEMGIFEMREEGLREVANPSEIFLSERPMNVAGSTVVASMEGTRPILVELQALVSSSSFGVPRRVAQGVDHHRVSFLMAVLEKRVGMQLAGQDAYVNVAGGVRLDEPAIDLAMTVSIASTFREKQTNPYDVIIGEVGLTGEVRGVTRIEQRVHEARKLGFRRAVIPEKNLQGWEMPEEMDVIGVKSVSQALQETIGG